MFRAHACPTHQRTFEECLSIFVNLVPGLIGSGRTWHIRAIGMSIHNHRNNPQKDVYKCLGADLHTYTSSTTCSQQPTTLIPASISQGGNRSFTYLIKAILIPMHCSIACSPTSSAFRKGSMAVIPEKKGRFRRSGIAGEVDEESRW